MPLNQLSIFIENRPCALSSFANLLRENGVDMRALSLADVQDYGILRIIVDDVYRTSEILRNASYVFRITPVIAVPLKDSAGSLADVLEVLGKNGVNIEYLYAFVGRQKNRAYVIFRVGDADIERASRLLGEAGYQPVEQDALSDELKD